MSGVLSVLLGVSEMLAWLNPGSQAGGTPREPNNAWSSLDSLAFSAVRGVDYDYVHFYPEIEAIIRAHVRPDGASLEGIGPITFHHMRDLASLSIREQTIPNFLLFAGSPLRSLRLYHCRIKDFATMQHIAGIEELHLRGCGIRVLSFCATVSSVAHLSLANNNVEDITPLAGGRHLQWLDLRDNQIHSLSALKALHKLTYVDLRYNPLGPEADADILAIKANNPSVTIVVGQEPGVTKEDLMEQLSARAKIAEFARCVRWRYEDGVVMPMMPGVTDGEELPDEISKALLCLRKSQDKEDRKSVV
jgi:hypothetical protein